MESMRHSLTTHVIACLACSQTVFQQAARQRQCAAQIQTSCPGLHERLTNILDISALQPLA